MGARQNGRRRERVMRGGVIVPLPERAQDKLRSLMLARDAALDAGRSASARLNALPSDADPQMAVALRAEMGKQNSKHAQLSRLISSLNEWLMQQRPGTVLEMAPALDIELQPNQTVS